jgi:hypothetical protein
MASASQQGVERAEARFASFESEVHVRLAELTRELQAALAEMKLRLDRHPASRDPSAPWSLDDVTRLHGQLRDGVRPAGELPRTIEHPSVPSIRELTAGSVTDSSVVRSGIPAKWAMAVVFLGVAAVIAVVFGWRLQSQVKAASDRAYVAERTLNAALSDVARQSEAAREDAARQRAEMQAMTLRAQRMSDVAAAPDLIRFTLSGVDGASGQGLFSRSRGLVVNGWRLPPLPANSRYQAWLLTRTTPVKAGTLTVQADGSATLAQQTPPVPRAVIGVQVSVESSEEGETPSGTPVLSSSVPTAQPAAEAQP